MTDFAKLSIAPADSASKKPPKPKRRHKPYVPRCPPEERKAKAIANGLAGLAIVHANRGVTRWHEVAMAMPEGQWLMSRDVWALVPRQRVSRHMVASVLARMAESGDVERKPLPDRASAGLYKIAMPDGRVFFAASPQWIYRVTGKGLEKAREGRRRRAEADVAPKPPTPSREPR